MAKKLKNKTECNRSFVQFLFHTCFTYSDISFLVFLTFWIYSDAITDFQVLGQQFSFCKKILCFQVLVLCFESWVDRESIYFRERSTTIVSGPGLLL